MNNKLESLKMSLDKKESELARKLEAHFLDIKMANSQTVTETGYWLNSIHRWKNQESSLIKSLQRLEKTKQALKREQEKIEDYH